MAPHSKLPEVFAQLDSKITHMMKAVSAALVKDDRGAGSGSVGSVGAGGGSSGAVDPSSSNDMVRTTCIAYLVNKLVYSTVLEVVVASVSKEEV